MKRVISLALCLMLVMSLATVAFADETGYTLTIKNAAEGHTYEAYQIFAGDLAEKNDNQILSNIKWGAAIVNNDGDEEAEEGEYDHSAALLAAIKAEAGLSALHGATDAASLAGLLSGVTSDSATLDLFAEVVGDHIGPATGTSGEQEGDKYTITGLNAGYYLVKDQDNTLEGENDVYTKYIIRVLKSVEVIPKGDVPTVEKTINDTIDGTFTDVEDFDINDTAYYKWVGKLPSNLKSYEKYYYKFTDTLPTGIQHMDILQVYIEGHDGNLVHVFMDKTDADTENDTLPSFTVKVGEEDVPVYIEEEVNGNIVTLEFSDLLKLYPQILPTQKIVVKYSARVTRDALIAEPMTNKVKVEFSNNPNGEGKGETPEDVAHAFTFQINVDKYDSDNVENKLEGAEFVLYYERTENNQIVKYYAKVITEEMIAAGEVINGTPVDADDLGIVYGWTTDKTQASVLDTDANGHLGVKGLDEGIYYLEETKAPSGYNLMETPVMITILREYPTNSNVENIEVDVSYEVDSIHQDSDTVGVRNSSGSTLPSTGGIGTTLFYILGGLMVTGAAVLLVTKKRMGAEA